MIDVAQSYGQLIEQSYALDPPVLIFGGFAEDAVLHGKVTRSHGDLDVLVVRDQLDVHLEQFRALGFQHFTSYYDIAPGEPFVLGSERHGLNLEVCVFDGMPRGRLSCRLRAADGVLHRITLAAEAIDTISRQLDGAAIRTVSPLGLYQIRAASHLLGAFGDLRATDVSTQLQLKERFFPAEAEGDLLPDIERLPG